MSSQMNDEKTAWIPSPIESIPAPVRAPEKVSPVTPLEVAMAVFFLLGAARWLL